MLDGYTRLSSLFDSNNTLRRVFYLLAVLPYIYPKHFYKEKKKRKGICYYLT